MEFDSVILDIDGTIWNTTQIVAEAWNNAIKKHYPEVKLVTDKILQGQFGKTMSEIADNLFNPLNKSQRDDLIKKCCEEEQLALHNNTKDITYLNVISTISKLQKKYKLFIVSNCQSGYIELTMAKNKIENYITDFECYGNTGKGKAENLKLLCERNNLKNPIYVGDTQGDLNACKEAGVPFIWASYGFGTADSYYKKIDQFEDLLSIL